MKFSEYVEDKFIYILLSIAIDIIVIILLSVFNANNMLIILITSLLITYQIVIFGYDYIKRKIFYDTFKKTLNSLDKKYLITEMISKSDFLDGKILLDCLYEISKSMHEKINNYRYLSNELKEYIELWCHEIKTPIATSKLIIDNNNNPVTESILEELENIENYVEQVLYYSRSDTVEKDYIINQVSLKKVVDKVISRNKKDLINKKIKIDIDNLSEINSDSKWLEFIINQIILNSIKYSKDKNATIKIYSKTNKNNIILYIKDNGIGINSSEIEKVFDKGFTGTNGRKKYNSTGIGLYLCKKLCKKLGHEILIESIINEYTIVKIIFPSNSMTSINLTEM